MKTIEFTNWLNEGNWEYKETEDTIEIKGILTVYKHKVLILFERIGYCSTNDSFEVYKKAIEYAETPLSEREDMKKYRIQACEDIAKAYRYLTRTLPDKNFFFSSAIYREKEYQTRFTQQEIDNFSLEIKGAIDCGFLRKVEVQHE